ncbi:ABC transporter substrate-binding protein [Oscillospiraceae bacterium HV4-5-C5C]|nr:ABC transporter substrate-binding protein [Oscillospiraceae bacterium HV4-5-C5C]
MKRNLKSYVSAVLAAALSLVLTACSGSSAATTTTTTSAASTTTAAATEAETSAAAEQTTAEAAQTTSGDLIPLVVGASPSPHAEILAVIKDKLASEGYDLQITEFTDYVQPNVALAEGDLDANYFQHLPYLENYNEENGTDLVSAGAIHYEPFGIYAGKTKSLADLKEGAQIAVPNDTSNEARALLLLEANNLIKLKDGAGLNATKLDITENPLNLDIVEIEAAQLPRSLADVDLAVINGNYAIDAGLSVKTDALAVEAADSEAAQTYANIIAVRAEDKDSDKTKALVAALQSDEVRDYINNTFDGAVVPSF